MSDLRLPFANHLTDDGLAADGSNNAQNVNGSITPVPFYRGPASGYWAVGAISIIVEDNANFLAAGYGGLATLTNGISLEIRRGGASGTVLVDLLDGDPIQDLTEWAEIATVTYYSFGSGNNYATVHWHIYDMAGRPIVLNGNKGDVIVMKINDNLSTLVKHHTHIHGREIDYQGSRLSL